MLYVPFERVLSKDWPQRKDLDSNRLLVESVIVDYMENSFKNKQGCLVTAAEGHGKTVLARYFGYKYLTEKNFEVWHVDLSEEGGQGVDTVLSNIKDRGENRNVFQIIENIHANLEFWDAIKKEVPSLNSRFLFTSRIKQEELAYPKNAIEPIKLPSTKERIKAFIEWYVSTYNEFTDCPYKPPNIKPTDWDYDITWAYNEFSLNLRALTRCLEKWAKERPWRRLNMTNRESFLKSIVQERFKNLSQEQKATLIEISAVYQFEVPVWIEGLNLGALGRLSELSLVRVEGNYCYLEHTTDARHNVEGQAFLSPDTKVIDITLPCIRRYLMKRPPNFGRVFLHLSFQGEKSLNTKLAKDDEIMEYAMGLMPFDDFRYTASLISGLGWSNVDIRNNIYKHIVREYDPHVLADTVKEGTSLQSIGRFLINLRISKVEGWQDFGNRFLKRINRQYIRDAVALASMSTVKNFLQIVKYISPDYSDKLNKEISRKEWESIYQRSSFRNAANYLGYLLFTRPEQITPTEWVKARQTVITIVNSPNIDNQIGLTSVGRLGKLLGGFIQVDKHEGTKYAELMAIKITENVLLSRLTGKYAYKLEELSLLIHHLAEYTPLEHFISRVIAEVNLSKLIEIEPDIKALSHILWNSIRVGKGGEFISKIDEPTWLSMTKAEVISSLVDIFWLLWNLYQADQNTCRFILEKTKVDIISSLKTQISLSTEGWALIGLLDLCNIKILSTPVANLPELAEDLSNQRSIARFALILRYIRKLGIKEADDFEHDFTSKLSAKYQGLSVEELVEQFPAPGSRQILRKILTSRESKNQSEDSRVP